MLWAIAFSPDGKILASTSSDNTIKLWEVASGNCLTTFKGHDTWVMCAVFNPEGNMLAVGDGYAAITIWDIDTEQRIKTFNVEQIYEQMNIYAVTGLTTPQKSALLTLGCFLLNPSCSSYCTNFTEKRTINTCDI
ncbi:MAG TPA: hypothetical protein IGS40_03800 [Trichormus sp. M33_DOE_039]|nr:hypothetical protein [Trichormus sp. M33_DOE_039]